MRDANRLRRLVWSGPAPAGVASRPRTRAASGLRLAANTGCPPGAGWRAVHHPDGHEKRGPTPKGERRTARRRAPRLRKKACRSRTVAPSGAPSPRSLGEAIRQNSGAAAPREQWRL